MGENKPPVKEKYITPDELLQLWREYKKYTDENPDIQEVATNKGIQEIKVKKPYQRQKFETYVHDKYGFHIHQYIDNANKAYNSYLGTVTHIRNEWQGDVIEGTLTGRYKAPNFAKILLGLSEKQEVTHDGTVEIVMTKGKTLL